MKYVNIICLHLEHGGIERQVVSLANALSEKRYTVTIWSIYKSKCAYEIHQAVNVKFLTGTPPDKKRFVALVRSNDFAGIYHSGISIIKTLIAKYWKSYWLIKRLPHKDTVITTRLFLNVLSNLFCSCNKRIGQIHEVVASGSLYERRIKRWCGSLDSVTVPSRLQADQLLSAGVKNCHAIPNMIDDGETVSQTYSDRQNVVIAAGRLHPEKGFDRLIDIWRIFIMSNPGWKLRIIGSGAEGATLQNTIKKKNLTQSVAIEDFMTHKNLLEVFARSKIFVLPSYRESFGLVLVEAMACGTPVVAFDIKTGPREIVGRNCGGKIVEDNNIEEFAEAMKKFADMSADKFNEVSKKAQYQAKYYSKEVVIKQWQEII